jgi:hypothetical protein
MKIAMKTAVSTVLKSSKILPVLLVEGDFIFVAIPVSIK